VFFFWLFSSRRHSFLLGSPNPAGGAHHCLTATSLAHLAFPAPVTIVLFILTTFFLRVDGRPSFGRRSPLRVPAPLSPDDCFESSCAPFLPVLETLTSVSPAILVRRARRPSRDLVLGLLELPLCLKHTHPPPPPPQHEVQF